MIIRPHYGFIAERIKYEQPPVFANCDETGQEPFSIKSKYKYGYGRIIIRPYGKLQKLQIV